MFIYKNNYLEHYGVKGMKWGVRKDRTSAGSRNSRHTKRPSNKSGLIKKLSLGAATVGALVGTYVVLEKLSNKKIANGKVFTDAIINLPKTPPKSSDKPLFTLSNDGNPTYASSSPQALWERHMASKKEFDRWLTLKENKLGYKWQGAR